MSGPLSNFRVIELAGIGPGPMAAMLLSDLGAEVIRIERPGATNLWQGMDRKFDLLLRGRRSIAVDLKTPLGVEAVLRMIESADALIEGFRPGVMERLGLGPDECAARNSKLVYGRMTGFGQDGPLAGAAGHDINYIALSGALSTIGTKDSGPVPPLNLVADFGGGALYLALGICAALLEASQSGRGQIVDAAMVDGSASLMTATYGLAAAGFWSGDRGHNLLDGGAPFYATYQCADDKWVSIGPLEPRFYAEFLERLDLTDAVDRDNPQEWPRLRGQLEEAFRRKTRDEWDQELGGTDVCFAPVLSMEEATLHPHNVARGTFVEVDGVVQPGPAPRFSRTPGEIQGPVREPGGDTAEVLRDWGWSDAEIASLTDSGAIR